MGHGSIVVDRDDIPLSIVPHLLDRVLFSTLPDAADLDTVLPPFACRMQ